MLLTVFQICKNNTEEILMNNPGDCQLQVQHIRRNEGVFGMIDCTLSWLSEMQNELFHLRKNAFRQAPEASLTHSSLGHINAPMRAVFTTLLEENGLGWRPAGREGCSIAVLVGSSGQVLGRSERLLRGGWWSVAPVPHQRWHSCTFLPPHPCLLVAFPWLRWKSLVISFSFDLYLVYLCIYFWPHLQYVDVLGPRMEPTPQQGQSWILNLLHHRRTPIFTF